MSVCKNCGKGLTPDERAIYLRMINRGSKEFLCRDCLSVSLGVTPGVIDEKIRHFREIGCTLFASEKS